MAGCCPSRDYHRFFTQRFARRLANRYRKRGLDKTARKMVQFLQAVGIEGASVLEVGGGVGELEVELLKLEEAEAFNDPARATRARQEMDFLVEELARAVGLGGRDRRALPTPSGPG
jgi:hypothetical protein